MKDAKDCIRPRLKWLLVCLGLCLSSIEIGCTRFGGLHSVGTWPPFAHMWERGPGSPSPENDSYAQAMRPTLGLDGYPAGEEKRTDGQGSAKDAGSNERAKASSDRNASAYDESSTREDEDDSPGLRVTLGRPEPLPGVSVGGEAGGKPFCVSWTERLAAGGDGRRSRPGCRGVRTAHC